MATVPAYTVNVKPNHVHGADNPASNYNVVWAKHTSTGLAVHPNNNDKVFLTPNSPRSGAKSWEWWLAFEINVDSSFPTSAQGNFGTTNDAHNTSIDVPGGGQSIGWTFGSFVSSYYLSYRQGILRLQHQPNEPNHEFILNSNLPKGVWHSVLIQMILGRTDGTVSATGHPNAGRGRTRVWMNGSDTPFDTGNINNLQKATLNNVEYVQTALQGPWEGFYTQNTPNTLIFSTTATRMGTSLAACLADTPVKTGEVVANIYRGTGTNLGPSTLTTLTPRDTSLFLLPPSLGGGTPPADPTHTGLWSTALQWNAGPLNQEPPPTVVEQHIGPWSDALQWNAATDLSGEVPAGTITLTPVTTDTQTLTPLEA